MYRLPDGAVKIWPDMAPKDLFPASSSSLFPIIIPSPRFRRKLPLQPLVFKAFPAMVFIAKAKSQTINNLSRPASFAGYFPAPAMGGERLVRPLFFLPLENHAKQHIEKLVSGNKQMPDIMLQRLHWQKPRP